MTRSHVELAEWYARRLRPKLVHAAGAGAISPLRAAELERQMSDLLGEASDGSRGRRGRSDRVRLHPDEVPRL